jgi:hypothetical protein
MKRSRHTEEQIIAILKYGGRSVSEAKRLRALESENARLKKLFADAMLDNAMLARSWTPRANSSGMNPQ